MDSEVEARLTGLQVIKITEPRYQAALRFYKLARHSTYPRLDRILREAEMRHVSGEKPLPQDAEYTVEPKSSQRYRHSLLCRSLGLIDKSNIVKQDYWLNPGDFDKNAVILGSGTITTLPFSPTEGERLMPIALSKSYVLDQGDCSERPDVIQYAKSAVDYWRGFVDLEPTSYATFGYGFDADNMAEYRGLVAHHGQTFTINAQTAEHIDEITSNVTIVLRRHDKSNRYDFYVLNDDTDVINDPEYTPKSKVSHGYFTAKETLKNYQTSGTVEFENHCGFSISNMNCDGFDKRVMDTLADVFSTFNENQYYFVRG